MVDEREGSGGGECKYVGVWCGGVLLVADIKSG